MLLGLGCAYAMHVVTARQRADLGASVVEVARPVALSGLTTAIGFVAMASVPIDAIRELASYGALGVLVATLASLTLAPALLSLSPIGDAGGRLDRWLRSTLRDRLVGLVTRHRRWVLALWAVVFMASGLGLSRLEIATDIILWFPNGASVRDDYELVRSQLSGITPVNVLIEPSHEDAPDAHTPEVLTAIDALATDLQERQDVGKALSLGDPLRVLSRVFERKAVGRLPTTKAEIEQYLLVLSGVDELDDVIHRDRRSANILLRVDDNSSDDIVAIGDWVRDWWAEQGVEGFRVTTTGIMYEFGRAEEAIAHGQIRGLVLAGATIGVILFLVLRQIGVASIALLVNLVPIGIGFGLLGLLRIPLDAATVCLGSMALGIAVDDTIHVVTAYGDGGERHGSSLARLHAAFTQVLPALVVTTASISVGFAALGFSGFTLIRNLGFVTAGLVSLCLIADLTLLPAMLVGRDRRREQ
jgi:predicted RND superfamily exporter protein